MGRRLRMAQPQTKPTAQPVRKVEGRVMKTAMRIAKGDRSRIEIVGDNEVIVHNNRRAK